MKHILPILLLAASAAAACAQTPAKPAAPAAAAPKAATTAPSTIKSAAPAAKATAPTSPTIAAVIKVPAGVPQYKGIQKTIFTAALRYQDIKIGTGAAADPDKLYKVLYTGWRAADGVKFDSSDDHRQPLRDKGGKPVLGDDGKPKLGDAQPLPFLQGKGGAIPGFDQGFVGMKVGGKRRLFIPWQMAYGSRAIPDHGPDHPGIPSKSDLIFDVELVDVADAPASPAMHPPMGSMHGGPPPMPVKPGTPGAPPPQGQPGAAAPSAPPPAAGSSSTPSAPATSTPPASTPPATPAPATTPAQPPSK
jgi:peptidylprolyl isomerase